VNFSRAYSVGIFGGFDCSPSNGLRDEGNGTDFGVDWQEDVDSEQRLGAILVSLQVDGLLIVSLQETALFFEQMPKVHKMPIIFMGQPPEETAASHYVGVDEGEAGELPQTAMESDVALPCNRRVGAARTIAGKVERR
jgi:hypothetical protein